MTRSELPPEQRLTTTEIREAIVEFDDPPDHVVEESVARVKPRIFAAIAEIRRATEISILPEIEEENSSGIRFSHDLPLSADLSDLDEKIA